SGASSAFPLPGKPLSGAGSSVRQLPRDRPVHVLREVGLLDRPTGPGGRSEPDLGRRGCPGRHRGGAAAAAVLRPDEAAGGGNSLVIPLEQSFLYVQPVFVQSNQPDAFPVLKRVVVFHGGTVGLGSTLQEAIANSFQGVSTGNGNGGQGQQGAQGNTSQQIQS